MLRVFGTLFDLAIEHQLQDAILVAPVSCAVGFAQGLVTFGSPDFFAFILAYFVEVALAIVERVYIDESLDMIFTFIGLIFSFVFRIGTPLTHSLTHSLTHPYSFCLLPNLPTHSLRVTLYPKICKD